MSGQDNVSANLVVNIPNLFIATFVLFSFEYETISILIKFCSIGDIFYSDFASDITSACCKLQIGGH